MEYEFDIVADMDLEHNFIVSKTRCRALDGAIINKPGVELAKTILDWLTDGAPAPHRPAPAPATPHAISPKTNKSSTATTGKYTGVSTKR